MALQDATDPGQFSGYGQWGGQAPPPARGGTPIGAIGNGAAPVALPSGGNNTFGSLGPTGAGQQGGMIGEFGTYGQYGTGITQPQIDQSTGQHWSIAKDVNYGDYQRLQTQAQNAGLQGQAVLSDPRAAAALQAQQGQAGSASMQQLSALGQQNSALGNLYNAANGNGPTAADIQSQQSISQAMRAQLTAAASARGGAYAQAAAQQTAAQQAAGIQAQGVGQAAALRAQEQQQAQSAYAQAAGQAVTGANQAYVGQSTALNQATGAAQNEQGLGLNYNNAMANLYNQQGSTAATLASNQVANDYGLSGTQLQTSTQQNIANQQQTQNYIAGGLAAVGTLASLASDERGKESVEPQSGGATRPRGMSAEDVHQELARMRGGKKTGGGGSAPVADSFLDALSRSKATYAYRDDANQPVSVPRPHGARYGGVMAQDLERVPEIGRQLVTDTPQGKKLELPSVTSAALMGLGRLAERVAALEGRRS